MRFNLYLLILFILFLTSSLFLKADEPESLPELIFTTSNNPPYVYKNNKGELIGSLVDKLKKIMTPTTLKYSIKIEPWKRSLVNVQKNETHLIFPLSRTEAREKSYSWIIPLHVLKFKIYGFKGTFDPKNVDITSGKYTFVCPERTILCSSIRKAGVPESSIVAVHHIEHEQMINMVFYRRVDFLLISDNGLGYYLKSMGLDQDKLAVVENYEFKKIEYLAGKPDFNPAIIDEIRSSFNTLNVDQ